MRLKITPGPKMTNHPNPTAAKPTTYPWNILVLPNHVQKSADVL